jgi:PAS domain S-box-containing protein
MTLLSSGPSIARSLSKAGATVSVAAGSIALIGWLLGIKLLRTILPGFPSMVPNTALGLIFSGISLALQTAQWPSRQILVRVGRMLAAVVVVFGALIVSEYVFRKDFGIDRILLPNSVIVPASFPGRPSPQTGTDFALAGLALLFLEAEGIVALLSQLLAIATATIAMVALLGYVFGVASFYVISASTGMAVQTAVAFLVLSAGMLCAHPDRGTVRTLFSETSGGRLGRWMLPAILIFPALIGYLRFWGEHQGFYAPQTGEAMMVVATMVTLVVFACLAAESLDRVDEQFRALADNASDGVISANSKGVITYCNHAAEKMFGYSLQETRGESLAILMPDRFHEAHKYGFERFLSTGQSKLLGRTVDLTGRRKDGSEFPLGLSLASWKAADKIHVTGILRDMTERKQAEERLRRSEERLRLLIEGARDYAIFSLDASGYVRSWNLGAEKIKGYTADEIIGRHFSCFYPGEDIERGKPDRELKTVGAEGRLEDEGWRVRKDGSRFWANVIITALRDPEGHLVGFSKISRDLTERRRAEEEVLQLNRELERSNTELLAVNKELESFSYSVSHDLRAPLRAIDGFSAAVLEDCRDKLDEQARADLERVRSATARMAVLIDDLLKMARTARREVVPEEVDLSSLAREIASELKSSCPDRKTAFVIGSGLTVTGDPGLLRVVLENLLGNAWKFTSKRADARIEIGQRQLNGQAPFFISDNGAGFDMQYADKLFGAFQRLHDEAEFPGTGVGLATVQHIVHRHGGRIWAESMPGKGTTFYFVFKAAGGKTSGAAAEASHP